MIDVVHTKQGKSFVGLVNYLMEGSKGAENPDRVAWTATRNLGTGRPKTAARVMAMTALDQRRIMQDAGTAVRKKSTNHVLHYVLSWEEGSNPSREEMLEALDGSLAVLGETAGQKGGRKGKKGRVAKRDQFANEHQVLAVRHQDSTKPHLHVVVNRVHPEHGVLLPDSNDFLKLSRWAEKFEREHGGLVVDARAIANEARDNGEKVYGKKRKSRDVYELEQQARNNHPEALELQAKQRAKDAELAKKSAALRARHKQAWKDLLVTHKARGQDLRADTAQQINASNHKIRSELHERKAALMAQQRVEEQAFKAGEASLLGAAKNALRLLVSLSGPVNVIWSHGARIHAFRTVQEDKRKQLDREERRLKREAAKRIRTEQKAKSNQMGLLLRLEREETILRHRMEKAGLRASWKTRLAERGQAWTEHAQRMAQRPPEQSFGRQELVADERTREMIESAKRLMEHQRSRARDPRDTGRDANGR
jgi:hypothetical protein